MEGIGDLIGDLTGEGFGETRWVTYAELARIRCIGRESAVKLVQREGWRRQPGNGRSVRALVPVEWLKPAKIGEGTPEGFGEVLTFAKERTEAADLRAEQAEAARMAAEARADTEHVRANRAETHAKAERARADQAEVKADAERDKAAAVERLLAQTVATHNRIAVEVEALREADRARRAAGRMARLRAAWRGE